MSSSPTADLELLQELFEWIDHLIKVKNLSSPSYPSIVHSDFDYVALDFDFKIDSSLKLMHPVEVGTLKEIDLVARFVGSLDYLLTNNKTALSSSGVDVVLKELKFFIAIFSDNPFQATGDEKVQCLFQQLQGIVYRAGRLVHSITPPSFIVFEKMNECLSEPIKLLKANIIEFLETLPSLTTSKVFVDSFFVIESVIDDLGDLLDGIHGPIVEIKDEIEKLHQGLMISWSLLEEHVENEEYKEIAVQIRDIAYAAEYLIRSFLVGDVPIWYFTISLTNVIHHVELLMKRIQEMKKKNDGRALKLAKSIFERPLVQGMRGMEVDDDMIGFEEEEKSILEQLLYGNEGLQIISICGTPGVGKTTLAKRIYKNPSIGNRFDKHSWSIVSQKFCRKDLLADILRNLGGRIEKGMDEKAMALKIHQALKYRRYIIILDDIWNSDALDDLQAHCFPDDGNYSRILFTSRDGDVAPTGSIMNALHFLSDDQCCELLEKKGLNGKIALPSELQGIAKKIATKCKGLPLVVVVIAGILSTIPIELNAWKKVEENLDAHIFSDQDKSIMQILKLSYKHLSRQLRPCFLYFGVFEEDTKISIKKLQRFWIAEGFIQKEKGKSKETVAEEYFTKLVNQSLVTVVEKGSDGGVKTCVIHDLLREMCLRIAEGEGFLKYVSYSGIRKKSSFSRYLRQRFPSFLCDDNSHMPDVKMKLLRALKCQNDFVLHGVESLNNLRYLEMEGSPGVTLSIGSFVNLEYLIVDTKFRISSQILKMLKLRFLKAHEVCLYYHSDIPQTNKLEFLSDFQLCSRKDEEMLKSSLHLRRLKCFYYCLNVEDTNSTPRCFDLRFLTHLQSLSLSFHSESTFVKFHRPIIKFPLSIRKLTLRHQNLYWFEMQVIGALPNLEVLKLEHNAFVGKRWDTRDNEFQKLRFLKLCGLDLEQWNVSSSQHLPVLEQLLIRSCWYLDEIPNEVGDIMTLQLIELEHCRESIQKSAAQIQQEQQDLGNEGLTIRTQYMEGSEQVVD